MIVLTVVRYNAAPTTGPSARFDELGGTIGRADQNQLVLPDPDRTISRVHARIVHRNGRYSVVDNGSNPITVNGRALSSGAEQALSPGDEVQIGAYTLAVTDGQAATSDDPFADLFGEGLAATPSAPTPAPRAAPKRAAPAPAPKASSPSAGGIPEDWDPFAPDEDALPANARESTDFDPLADMVRVAPSEDSLDDLFGLGDTPRQSDPLAKAMPSEAGPRNTASHGDPLAALGRASAAPAATAGDLGSDLNTPMPMARAPKPASKPADSPSGAVFSWDETGSDFKVVTAPGVRRAAEPPPAPPSPSAPQSAARAPAPASPRGEPAPAAGSDALLNALLEGLAAPELRLEALTPEKMRLVGQLLHEATRGTVELLVARAALKRELRADVTMIVAKENNPLKFSPTADVALQHLLGTPMAGFMAPAPAMRDAYDDLRAHQLGVMAGMRAALEGVLLRFDPAQLEAKLVQRASITNLIPGARKARLWESFQELFSQLQSEAQDDFDELFGKAFLSAYESHIDRLRDEPGPR